MIGQVALDGVDLSTSSGDGVGMATEQLRGIVGCGVGAAWGLRMGGVGVWNGVGCDVTAAWVYAKGVE